MGEQMMATSAVSIIRIIKSNSLLLAGLPKTALKTRTGTTGGLQALVVDRHVTAVSLEDRSGAHVQLCLPGQGSVALDTPTNRGSAGICAGCGQCGDTRADKR